MRGDGKGENEGKKIAGAGGRASVNVRFTGPCPLVSELLCI